MLMISAGVAGVLPAPLKHIFRPVLPRLARNTAIEPTSEGRPPPPLHDIDLT
jgi:hypothetical protein